MGERHYIERDGKPVAVPFREWVAWMFCDPHRQVAATRIAKGVDVSTVFLGLDHSFGGGPPILYETLVFGGPLDGQGQRTCTREQAVERHKQWVAHANEAECRNPTVLDESEQIADLFQED